jgi:hypothetical protein
MCTADRDDECPEEYECDMASDDQYYCCPAWDRCPSDSTPFLVEGSRKPLGCNWMANNCPEGYRLAFLLEGFNLKWYWCFGFED